MREISIHNDDEVAFCMLNTMDVCSTQTKFLFSRSQHLPMDRSYFYSLSNMLIFQTNEIIFTILLSP